MAPSTTFTWKTTAEEVAKTFQEQIKDKIVLVTGVSPKSLGEETVRVIAPYAKTIIVASRSTQRAEEALEAVRKETPSADFRVVSLDLSSEKSIRAAAAEVLALNLPINVVINNAAVAQYSTLHRTEQGFEAQFGSNHLGHFLFISLIFSAIKAGASPAVPARVVNVSSLAVTFPGLIRWDDTSFELRPDEYSKYPAYTQSKIANVLFAREISNRYAKEGVLGFSLHPGAIYTTNMGAAVPLEELVAIGLANPDGTQVKEGIAKDIPQGTATQIAAAFDPSLVAHPGAYLDDCVPHDERIPDNCKSDADSLRLWELSEKLWDIKFAA